MAEELTLENFRAMAEHRGLRLVEDELKRLLPGVNRARKQAAELRELVTRQVEPGGAYGATSIGESRRL